MKRIYILLSLTLIAGAIAFFSHQQEKALSPGAQPRELMAPNLSQKGEDLQQIVITQKGEFTYHMDLKDKVWRLREFFHYPIKRSLVNKLIQTAADSKLIQQKTSDPDKMAFLGLASQQSTQLKFLTDNDDDPALADIFVGRSASGNQASYIRHSLSPESWLTSGDLTVPEDAKSWLQNKIMSVSAHRIRRITTTRYYYNESMEERLSIGRDEPDQNFKLINPPKEKHEINQYHLGIITQGLEDLVFSDVMPVNETHGASPYLTIHVNTFDGVMIYVHFYSDGNDWMYAKSEYNPELSLFETEKDGTKLTEEEAKNQHDKLSLYGLLTPARAKQQVEAINRRTSKWIYRIPTGSYSMLSRGYKAVTGLDNKIKKELPYKRPVSATDEMKKVIRSFGGKGNEISDSIDKLDMDKFRPNY